MSQSSAEPVQADNVSAGPESTDYEPSRVGLEWQDVSPGEDTVLADPVTTVTLTNESESDVTRLRTAGSTSEGAKGATWRTSTRQTTPEVKW